MAEPGTLREVEQWFLRRGIPHFIHDYSARRDVFTRSLKLLVPVALFEVAGAFQADWPWWANLLAAAGGFALLLGAWALVNRARGLPALTRPASVGPVELTVFVVVAPAVLPLVFGGQEADALAVVAGNLLLLGLIYAGTSYGVVPMSRWALARAAGQLGSLLALLTRALPLLLLFVTFLFVNPDVWQVAASLGAGGLAATSAFFAVVATGFVVARLPREVAGLSAFASWEEVASLTAGTPAAALVPSAAATPPAATPLSRREWGNVGLVVLFSQAVQVLLVAVVILGFFLAFGMVAITAETTTAWTGAPEVLLELPAGDRDLLLTSALLHTSVFLAAFSGLYFTVVALTDTTYRQEFYEEVVAEVRQAFAVRAAYEAAARK